MISHDLKRSCWSSVVAMLASLVVRHTSPIGSKRAQDDHKRFKDFIRHKWQRERCESLLALRIREDGLGR